MPIQKLLLTSKIRLNGVPGEISGTPYLELVQISHVKRYSFREALEIRDAIDKYLVEQTERVAPSLLQLVDVARLSGNLMLAQARQVQTSEKGI